MTENKEKVIHYNVIYDSEGNPTIKLNKGVKLSTKQMNHMLAMSRLQYPILLENYKERLIETLQEVSEFFDEHSSSGFFGMGEPKLDGLVKEEYLQKEQDDFIKTNKQISMKGTLTIKEPINLYNEKERKAQELKRLIKNAPTMTYDKKGNVSLSKSLKLHTEIYEGAKKVDEYDSALIDGDLLNKSKKKK